MAKNRKNREKHGISLAAAEALFRNVHFEDLDDRSDYGEDRWRAIGLIEGRVFVCAYTLRGRSRRIISLRRATKLETEAFFEKL